ncbi:type II secretion system protein GspE, partial [Patescibacteria group bacterium]|nr:type II secretion system protein GspE [Patescibacteria group bacterium]MBU1970453.1 type II secretion system protein GspE [Patescibacteria group bacterium]
EKHYGGAENSGGIRVYKGTGCKLCHGTGYFGRLGIFEVLEVSNSIKQLINERADAGNIEDLARREGMVSMLDDGLSKLAQGLTTLEEILRVIKTEEVVG